jgi:integrase/recombinase XerD
MNWQDYISEYISYLKLEKSLSENSIAAYKRDISMLLDFLEFKKLNIPPAEVELIHLRQFISWVNELGMSARTQARVISGIKSFYKFLLIDEKTDKDPTALLEAPKIGRRLPEVLSVKEIDDLINAIDLSKPEGHRNKAIIETLYSCGLRVSELISLKLSDLFFDQGFIKVLGKGKKERLVPISQKAVKEIETYINQFRNHHKINRQYEDILFLNRWGRKLTRVMIFTIVKTLAQITGLKKNISPHTFRHSFASHLIDGGADLRAIQEMLGHESIITTEIYTHLDTDYLRDTIIRFHPRA